MNTERADPDAPPESDHETDSTPLRDEPSRVPTLPRRRLLALSGVAAAGALAGCGGDDGGDSPTTTTDDTTTEPTTAQPTTETTTETTVQTTTATSVSYDEDPVIAPSSELAPTDGFATTDWLSEPAPEIVRVTNLDPAGEGSFRAALSAEGPRIVIFEVGGVIDLDAEGIEIGPGQGNLYVAGQTAPSPGVTLIRGGVLVDAENVVIQHLRVRTGDVILEATDSLSVGETGKNVIFDHCSVSWGTDENMSTGGSEQNHTITFSNNVVAEALSESIHPKGEHSKGTLVMNEASDVAVLGSVYAHNKARNPRLKGGTSTVVVNNYVYYCDDAITIGGDSENQTAASVVGNRWSDGPGTQVIEEASPHELLVSVEDNQIFEAGERVEVEDQAAIVGEGIEVVDEPPVWPDGDLEPIPADDVAQHNLVTAGARPADRTPHDQRVLDNVRTLGGNFVDSQRHVDGYPDLEATERALDPPAPGEGFGSWIAQHTRAVELGEDPPA